VMHLNSLRKKNEHLTVDAVYSICGSTLPVVSTVPDLGVSYDNKFSFWPHINSIVSKAFLRAKLILKCFVTRDSDILCKAFCASAQFWSFLLKYEILILRWILRKLKTSKDASLQPSFQNSHTAKD